MVPAEPRRSTTAPAAVGVGVTARIAVDAWDPSYAGMAEAGLADALDESDAPVNLDVEQPADTWRPVPARGPAASAVHVVDGVRRVEARVWFLDDDSALPGLAASYAAGAVVCDGAARVARVAVERGLFAASPRADDIRTPCGEVFHARRATDGDLESLYLALQSSMRALEVSVAEEVGRLGGRDLLVIDGPLRGRENLPRAIGYIKSHHASYLPPEQHAVVARLGPGERTPVFLLGSHWIRHAWYLRLPGPPTHPWAGIVRCECSATLSPGAAIEIADVSAATLPAYASQPHKDGRAPQNLYPIAGLERHLRHRLGDRAWVYRELSRAAST